MKRRVFFVGPLPPPVHGFSAINAAMVGALRPLADVVVFDRAASATAPAPLRAGRLIGMLASFSARLLLQRPASVYTGISGGNGQWIDLLFLAVAKGLRVPVIAHHHSFAYANRPTKASRLLMRALRDDTHVVLCDAMGALLASQYRLEPAAVRVLSNAAFVPPEADRPTAQAPLRPARPLRIGFLSNISRDKGIFDYFAVMAALADRGVKAEGWVAGPVAPEIAEAFDAKLEQSSAVRHVGAVYGPQKQAFVCALDVLLFPTRYVNEAEPVTVLEALSAGVVVMAADRACIAAQIGADGGQVVPIALFEQIVVEALALLDADRPALDRAQRCAQDRFRALRASNQDRLHALLDVIVRPPASTPSRVR